MPKPPQKSSKSIRQASRPLARPAKPARSASSPYQSRAGQAYRDQPAPYRREEAEPEAAAPKPRKPAPLRAYPARFKSPDDSSPKVSPKPSPKPSSKPSPKPSFARPPAAQPAARPNTARQAAPANQTSRPAYGSKPPRTLCRSLSSRRRQPSPRPCLGLFHRNRRAQTQQRSRPGPHSRRRLPGHLARHSALQLSFPNRPAPHLPRTG